MGWGSMWAQARNAFYKKTGINKRLPKILGQRAAASLNRRPASHPVAHQAAAQPVAQHQAAQPAAKNNNTMLYVGGAALLALKFLL